MGATTRLESQEGKRNNPPRRGIAFNKEAWLKEARETKNADMLTGYYNVWAKEKGPKTRNNAGSNPLAEWKPRRR